jgi:hypothetical protein
MHSSQLLKSPATQVHWYIASGQAIHSQWRRPWFTPTSVALLSSSVRPNNNDQSNNLKLHWNERYLHVYIKITKMNLMYWLPIMRACTRVDDVRRNMESRQSPWIMVCFMYLAIGDGIDERSKWLWWSLSECVLYECRQIVASWLAYI